MFNGPEVGEISKHLFQCAFISQISGIEDVYFHDNEGLFFVIWSEGGDNMLIINNFPDNHIGLEP